MAGNIIQRCQQTLSSHKSDSKETHETSTPEL